MRNYKRKKPNLVKIGWEQDNGYEFWISFLPENTVRIGFTGRLPKNHYEDYFIDDNSRERKTIFNLLCNQETEILGKKLILKLINVDEDEFIQTSLRRFRK